MIYWLVVHYRSVFQPVPPRVLWDHRCSVKILSCVQHLWPPDAFFRFFVGPKCICSPQTPLGELTAFPQSPYWWGGGWLLHPQKPLPRSQPSASYFSPLGLRSPPKDMGSVSYKSCCKGFCFTEKVEKHCITEWLISVEHVHLDAMCASVCCTWCTLYSLITIQHLRWCLPVWLFS